METLGQLVTRLREASGLTQGQLATYARVSRSWLSRVEVDDIKRPDREMLERLANILRVDPASFLSLAGYRVGPALLPPERSVEQIARELVAAVERDSVTTPLRVRQFFAPGSAGEDGNAEPEYWSYDPKPHEKNHHFIAVLVAGDCLLSRVRPGETVIVDEDASPYNGSIVVARHEGAMLIKVYQRGNGQAYLTCETLDPIAVNETTHILGVVVEITRRP